MTQSPTLSLTSPIAARAGTPLLPRAMWNWLDAFRQYREQRRTDALLAGLDRSTLEDIGVPHLDCSPTAGRLDRYPRVIAVRHRTI